MGKLPFLIPLTVKFTCKKSSLLWTIGLLLFIKESWVTNTISPVVINFFEPLFGYVVSYSEKIPILKMLLNTANFALKPSGIGKYSDDMAQLGKQHKDMRCTL